MTVGPVHALTTLTNKEPAVTEVRDDMTLGELVNAAPTAARILESLGLDYCCGGHQRLTDACRRRGIDPLDVIERIQRVPPSTDEWTTMAPVELVRHLVDTHHAYVRTELERLLPLADKVLAVHGARHPELADVDADLRDLRDDLLPHLLKEERVLFPMIVDLARKGSLPQLGPSNVNQPIVAMTREHDTTGELLDRLRRHAADFAVPPDACASYASLYSGLAAFEADTHLHIHKENNLLFPAARKLEARRVGHVPVR